MGIPSFFLTQIVFTKPLISNKLVFYERDRYFNRQSSSSSYRTGSPHLKRSDDFGTYIGKGEGYKTPIHVHVPSISGRWSHRESTTKEVPLLLLWTHFSTLPKLTPFGNPTWNFGSERPIDMTSTGDSGKRHETDDSLTP